MRELEMNPYVIQMDKFARSLEKLSGVLLNLEKRQSSFTDEEWRRMCTRVCERSCMACGNHDICLGRDRTQTYALLRDVFQAIEDCGTELNIEVKRKLQKYCAQAPRFLKHALEVYRDEKQTFVWNQKMAQNREGCAVQLDSFAQMIQHATRELDAGIFADEHLEKKLRLCFSRANLRLLTTVFFVSAEGRYEIHVTVKAQKGQCVPSKEVAQMISDCCGRKMVLGKEERPVVGTEYCTITCVEGVRYHTLQGVARIGKGCRRISGDSFSMMDLPNGKQGIILSDGMGAGEVAYRESAMVVELLEELLGAGFPKETALQMLNTALVLGREEVRFSTIDMSVFDLYSGKCEFVKAGASTTFLKHGGKVECIKSTSLPIGVLSKLELQEETRTLTDGDFVIMVTDGVMDALPTGEQELLLQVMIEGTNKTNPKEIAQHILEQVMTCSGEVPMDDMTVLAIGIWSLEK
ncbi:MAG: SpoIIE family protein phosphatase [Faecalimonas sp.]|nr:SpoIIE family protein phosphatase [Faecalimonas sp.]